VHGFKKGFTLLPHQVQGRIWLKQREEDTRLAMGGILADDMGLGKTVQMLTCIVDRRPKGDDMKFGWAKATLIVCPKGLVNQWDQEIDRFVKDRIVIVHTGQSRTTDPAILARAHVVITTYNTLASEHGSFAPDSPKKRKKIKTATFGVQWWRVILDEAHLIKNASSACAKACFALNSKHRWCVTGTPMQNKIDDLYSFMKFLRVKDLADRRCFDRALSDPGSDDELRGATGGLKVSLDKLMLRRLKHQIFEGDALNQLPPKDIQVVSCLFSAAERRFYDNLQGALQEDLQDREQKERYTYVWTMLLRLRQACDHPDLVPRDFLDSDTAEEEETDDFDEDEEVSSMVSQLNLGATPRSSTKTNQILDILAQIKTRSDGTEKTIIFSEFTSMLNIIEPFLRVEGYRFVRYDGKMSPEKREASLQEIRYREDTLVILISITAGSTGLNLTSCNNVILVDMWWNPAREDQAFDRTHRIGQKKKVYIYKLKIDDTVEDRILELQKRKRNLAAETLGG
ncbi:hypothetical protein PLICRDRAFT_59326, partial [Plicaturopsis crispa FD-325 SS-3]